jgi:polysaccharide deacetylase family protein (PEP-CTERM system associated)
LVKATCDPRPGLSGTALGNAFTVDLEEWFCSHVLRKTVPYATWDRLESRVWRNTEQLLSLLSRHGAHATFFVLGWVAERHPTLITAISAEGHEIATHGYAHRLVTQQSPAAFEADVRRSLDVLRELTRRPVSGYRAPAFSLNGRVQWALDVLADCGLRYDSSIHPAAFHPDYGAPGTSLTPYLHDNGLIEVPVSCAPYRLGRVPCGGGAYFRLMPYRMFRALAHRCVDRGQPLVFYIHPWEWDTDTPRVRTGPTTRFRLRAGAATVSRKLETLLRDFSFTSLETMLWPNDE